MAAAPFPTGPWNMSWRWGRLAVGALALGWGAGGPLGAAGALKIIYDLAIWSAFKRVSVDEG